MGVGADADYINDWLSMVMVICALHRGPLLESTGISRWAMLVADQMMSRRRHCLHYWMLSDSLLDCRNGYSNGIVPDADDDGLYGIDKYCIMQ